MFARIGLALVIVCTTHQVIYFKHYKNLPYVLSGTQNGVWCVVKLRFYENDTNILRKQTLELSRVVTVEISQNI